MVNFALVVALAVWLGQTVFLSLIVAPTLFRQMASPAEAGAVMTLLFPRYYLVGAICGALVAAACWWSWLRSARPRGAWLVAALAATLALGAGTYAGAVVQPRAHEMRAALHSEPTARGEFDRLHRLAVQLNGAVLLLALVTAAAVSRRLR